MNAEVASDVVSETCSVVGECEVPLVTVSRRAVMGAGIAVLGGVAAGCARAVRSPVPPTAAATTTDPIRSVPPSPTATPSSGPPPATVPAGPAVEVAHGSRARPEVALTFHGAGDVGIARQLLAIFAAHQVRVTVLAVGTWLAASPQIGREIVDAGHELGNHTYTHPDLDSMGPAAVQAEIAQCRDLLTKLVGSAGVHFRQSQAQHSTPLVRQLAGAAGYRTVLSYDVDSLDYTDPGPARIRSAVAAAQPGSIVSMHFGHADTVAAMPLVLADLAARGLTPVTATQLMRA
jgi:peptidoglycan/xylan/chitin deacetylase (PgdA/CDA1 family)